MNTIQSIIAFLEQLAPPQLAEEWDNVGFLVGDRGREARKVMTCLTVTPQSAAEAIQEKADLIVTHHPLPFTALKRLTTDTAAGRLLWDLIAQRIAVYSAHTAFDSAREGVNQRLAVGLSLRGITPLIADENGCGPGRWGWLEEPLKLAELGARLKKFLSIEHLQIVGPPEREIRTVAVACGAADQLLPAAEAIGCDCLVLGEARFHTCLQAEAAQIALLLPGHFASERFALECLAQILAENFPDLNIWASRREQNPLQWL
jgi:dinuclear metal center YbgI/SA1388 family protein